MKRKLIILSILAITQGFSLISCDSSKGKTTSNEQNAISQKETNEDTTADNENTVVESDKESKTTDNANNKADDKSTTNKNEKNNETSKSSDKKTSSTKVDSKGNRILGKYKDNTVLSNCYSNKFYLYNDSTKKSKDLKMNDINNFSINYDKGYSNGKVVLLSTANDTNLNKYYQYDISTEKATLLYKDKKNGTPEYMSNDRYVLLQCSDFKPNGGNGLAGTNYHSIIIDSKNSKTIDIDAKSLSKEDKPINVIYSNKKNKFYAKTKNTNYEFTFDKPTPKATKDKL